RSSGVLRASRSGMSAPERPSALMQGIVRARPASCKPPARPHRHYTGRTMVDPGFVEHCLELLAPLGRTRAGRMFSGYGLYVDELCIALLLRDTLYLKVSDEHRAAFEAAGCKPFTYEMKTGEIKSLSYYTAPDEAMESPAEMRPWARRALDAAI